MNLKALLEIATKSKTKDLVIKPLKKKTSLFSKEGTAFSMEDKAGHLLAEVKKDKVFVHDVFTDTNARGKGEAANKLANLIEQFPDKEIWTAATSKGMDKTAEKLGFELIKKKGRGALNPVPPEVDYPNANIWKWVADLEL